MSIDMTTVKKIMNNDKEVAKIEDLNGNILWQSGYTYQYWTDENHFLCTPKTGTYKSGIPTKSWNATNSSAGELYCIFKFDNTADTGYHKVYCGLKSNTDGGNSLELSTNTNNNSAFTWRYQYNASYSSYSQKSIAYESSATNSSKWTPNTKKYVCVRYNSGAVETRQKNDGLGWTSWYGTSYPGISYSANKIWLFNRDTIANTDNTAKGMKIALFQLGDDRWYPCKRSDGKVGMCHVSAATGDIIEQFVTWETPTGQAAVDNYAWIEDNSGNVM